MIEESSVIGIKKIKQFTSFSNCGIWISYDRRHCESILCFYPSYKFLFLLAVEMRDERNVKKKKNIWNISVLNICTEKCVFGTYLFPSFASVATLVSKSDILIFEKFSLSGCVDKSSQIRSPENSPKRNTTQMNLS